MRRVSREAAWSLSASRAWAFSAQLQAQSFGNTNWSAANTAGWAELDLIPMRVAYAEAIRERYRFYSFGDCMFISRRTPSPTLPTRGREDRV